MVADADVEAKMQPTWEGREERNVRAQPNRVSERVIETAKAHVLKAAGKAGRAKQLTMQDAQHRTEIASKAARARWKGSSLKKDKRSKRRRAWWRAKRMPKRISDETGGEG
jgi:hypothetical protein